MPANTGFCTTTVAHKRQSPSQNSPAPRLLKSFLLRTGLQSFDSLIPWGNRVIAADIHTGSYYMFGQRPTVAYNDLPITTHNREDNTVSDLIDFLIGVRLGLFLFRADDNSQQWGLRVKLPNKKSAALQSSDASAEKGIITTALLPLSAAPPVRESPRVFFGHNTEWRGVLQKAKDLGVENDLFSYDVDGEPFTKPVAISIQRMQALAAVGDQLWLRIIPNRYSEPGTSAWHLWGRLGIPADGQFVDAVSLSPVDPGTIAVTTLERDGTRRIIQSRLGTGIARSWVWRGVAAPSVSFSWDGQWLLVWDGDRIEIHSGRGGEKPAVVLEQRHKSAAWGVAEGKEFLAVVSDASPSQPGVVKLTIYD